MKLWGGRFSKQTAGLVDEFHASIELDQKLYKYDIIGSIAHARMLAGQGIITEAESGQIINCLNEILADIENGEIEFSVELEDIHMNIEKILIDRIGDVGKKLHTARSRNDQVAVDIRLYLRDNILTIKALIKELIAALVELADKNIDTIMPGYTHLQRAQPVTLGYHFLAYAQMFIRDYERLTDCYDRMNCSPLGAGALAGTTYETDRHFVADELGFAGVCLHGMDAVSDRDFIIEFISAAAVCMMHLSRFCEELIIWSTSEFNFIEMDDAYSTGSSIMPQKKNPDLAELIRGKTGRVYGNLFNILTIMKALPLAYNKDMQEDKLPLFDTVDTVSNSITVFIDMITTMQINKKSMSQAAKTGFMNATDAADYLVKKGLPFRECHAVIGRIVLYCLNKQVAIEDLSLAELKEFSDKFEEDFYQNITIEACVNAKKSAGSTSQSSMVEMVKRTRAKLISM